MTSFDRRTNSPSIRESQYTGAATPEPATFSAADPTVPELAALARALLGEQTLDDYLARVTRALGEGLGARGAGLWIRSFEEETATLTASFGERSRLESLSREVHDCLESGRSISVAGGWVVPARAFGDPLGVVAVVDSRIESPDAPPLLDLLAIAAAFAIREVQLTRELRLVRRQHRETQAQLLQGERLASIGETSGRLAGDLAVSLARIAEISRELAERAEDPGFGVLLHHARRAESHIGELQALSRLERPRLTMIDLAELTRQMIEERRPDADRRRQRLEEQYEPGLPKLLLDPTRVRQALGRILENAIEGTPEDQRLAIRVHRQGGHITVEIASEALPPEGGVLDLLFLPFGAGRSEIGLAVARQIVLDHGGEIEVGTGAEWPTVFRLRFPMRDNQDRRGHRERRRARDRRRAA